MPMRIPPRLLPDLAWLVKNKGRALPFYDLAEPGLLLDSSFPVRSYGRKTGAAMGIDAILNEIDHMRRQINRQVKDIRSLERAGLDTAAAQVLLGRMQLKLEGLRADRDRLNREKQPTYASGKVIRGTSTNRGL